jgi:hypothetical protein
MTSDVACKACVQAVLFKLGYGEALGLPAPAWLRGYAEYLCYFRFPVDEISIELSRALNWAEVFEEIKEKYPNVTASDLKEIRKQLYDGKITKAEAIDMAENLLKPKRKIRP